jgi:hypothetical protein
MQDDIQAKELSKDEIALRDSFIGEYMQDFNPFLAAIRCGFIAAHAVDWGKRLLEDAYVQRKVLELTRKPPEDATRAAEADKELIANTYRSVIATGSKSEQIAAARSLALMRGFEKPDTVGDAAAELANVMREFAQRAPV